MKAPISKRVIDILADQKKAEKLIQTVIKKNSSDNVISIGGKQYQLHKVNSFTKH